MGNLLKKKPCANPYKHKGHSWFQIRKPGVELWCPGAGSGAH